MKFSIKFKVVALGAILSIVVTTAALVFSNMQTTSQGKANQVRTMDEYFVRTQEVFDSDQYGGQYLDALSDAKTYLINQHALYPDEPEEGIGFDALKTFYSNRFKWCFAIENLGLYPMSDEEVEFRLAYESYVMLFSDGLVATQGNSVFTAFFIDETTLFFVCDTYSYHVITPENIHFPGSRIHGLNPNFTPNGNYFEINHKGLQYRAMPIKKDGTILAYLFIQYDFQQVYADAAKVLKSEIIALSITSVVMIIAFAVAAHFFILRNVSKLNKSASEFTNDLANNSKKLAIKDPGVKSRDEIGSLSSSFMALEEGIIKYVDVIQKETKDKERMNAELSIASNIQLSALPNHIYDDEKTSLRAFIKSAKEVGGDFYDYFYLDENRLAIIISDVSGKGIPAALFMMKSKELIKTCIHSNDNLVDAVNEVNQRLCRNNNENLFVTSFIGVIDFKKNIITYVNAGHEKPYIVSKDKVIKLDGVSNFVIGAESSFIYKAESHAFNKGDYIFLFTDGLNESINKEEEEFSYSRVEKVLESTKGGDLGGIIEKMNKNLEEFVGKAEQFDDVTMLIVSSRDNKLHLSYDKKDYAIISDIVDKFNETYAFLPAEKKATVGIVIDEIVNNLISYEQREDLVIEANFVLKGDNLVVEIVSNGNDYDPLSNHKKKYHEKFDPGMVEGGFGLAIVKDLSKKQTYKYKDGHSHLTVVIDISKVEA